MKRIASVLVSVFFAVALVGCTSSSGEYTDSGSQEKEQRAQRNAYTACSEVCYFTQGGALEDVSALLDAASTGNVETASAASSSLAEGVKALRGVNVPSDIEENHEKLLGASTQLGEAGIAYLKATMIYDSAMVEMNQTDLVEYNQYITEAGEKANEAADTLIKVKESLY